MSITRKSVLLKFPRVKTTFFRESTEQFPKMEDITVLLSQWPGQPWIRGGAQTLHPRKSGFWRAACNCKGSYLS
jgi:hypothetical protein